MTDVEYPQVWMTQERHARMTPAERTDAWLSLIKDAGLWPCLPLPLRDDSRMMVGMACFPLGGKNND